jgi:hypothetical protein
LFFGALLAGDLHLGGLLLYFALSCFKFTIQIDASNLKGWAMGL